MSRNYILESHRISFCITLSLTTCVLPGSVLFAATPVEKGHSKEPESRIECPMSPADRKANKQMQLEGKCGEGKCGVFNLQEGKCGEGKCGTAIKKKEGRCD